HVVGSQREIRAFGSPTVVHFCAALLISAIMSSPWRDVVLLGLCAGALGGGGLAYTMSVVLHAKKQTGYTPDAGDWFWYVALPLVAYVALACAGFLLQANLRLCLALIAAITLLFLFIGIHNAWDTVTYVVLKHHAAGRDPAPPHTH